MTKVQLLALSKEINKITDSPLRINKHDSLTDVAADIEWMFNFDLRGFKNHTLISLKSPKQVQIKIGGKVYSNHKTICKQLVANLLSHGVSVEQKYITKYQ